MQTHTLDAVTVIDTQTHTDTRTQIYHENKKRKKINRYTLSHTRMHAGGKQASGYVRVTDRRSRQQDKQFPE